MQKQILCPRCKIGHLIFIKEYKILQCDYCGYKTGGDIDKNGKIKNKEVEKENLSFGKRFELGSFI